MGDPALLKEHCHLDRRCVPFGKGCRMGFRYRCAHLKSHLLRGLLVSSLPEVCLRGHFLHAGEQQQAGLVEELLQIATEPELHPIGKELLSKDPPQAPSFTCQTCTWAPSAPYSLDEASGD